MSVDPSVKRVVLAYSGGLDTSVIAKWLEVERGVEVVTFTADLGQGEELGPAREKAKAMGIPDKHIFIEDLREEFVRDFVFPMMRMNARYEGDYLLGTSIARPLISKRLVEIAHETGADAIAHGATGKGNDQVRFELSAYALDPDIKVIAPWREWDLTSRTALIAWAEAHQIQVPKDKRGESPFSTDANLLHTSSEGKVLEDPWEETPDYVYSRTEHPEDAPDTPEYITIDFEKGDGVALNGTAMSPATLLAALNDLGRKHGVGRLDLCPRAPRDRADHARSGRRASQGRTDAPLRRAGIQRPLVQPRARNAAGGLRSEPGESGGHRPAEALQGSGERCRSKVTPLALLGGACHLRGRCGRIRPEGRRRLHQTQRAPFAPSRQTRQIIARSRFATKR